MEAQKKRRPLLVLGTIVLFLVVILLGIAGYWFKWDWTGFNEHIGPNVQQYQPAKTLWDWLQLLFVPAVLVLAASLFTFVSSRSDQKIATQRYENDKQIALDKQREDLLQTYLDRMSELLLDKHLRNSKPGEEVRNIAQVRTITILKQLDVNRIQYVFAFLHGSGLMSNKPNGSIISLRGAFVGKVDWRQARLDHADLSGLYLRGADLSLANLLEANLVGAYLQEANLREAVLQEANLTGAILHGADLRNANLAGASLTGARMGSYDYGNGYQISGANLTGAILHRADLTGADLKDALGVTAEELEKQAASLKDTIMPDGTKHS